MMLPLRDNTEVESEVRLFLRDFKQKMMIWDVLFRDDRGKNTACLSALELRSIDRKEILQELKVVDYSQGPISETLYGGSDMWVFGKLIKGKEVYIKITMGKAGSSVICISFHLAEREMSYPLK